MRFKGFKIGRSKDKDEKDAAKAEDNTAEQIVEMEEKISGRTKNLEETAQQLQELSDEADNSEEDKEVSAGPHRPLNELSIEPEDKLAEIDDVGAGTDVPEEEGEEIKVVEVSTESAPPPEGEKEVSLDNGDGDSINNLFSDDEEEENPLANLVKSLPDVTAQELVDDLDEIKGIIKEWQRG